MPSSTTEARRIGGSTRGVVIETGEADALVAFTDGAVLECDALDTVIFGANGLAPEDRVVVLHGGAGERPVIIGRIATAASRPPADAPDTLVVEARENLTLRCGEGSITIRADGRILIKGKDLVSHARRSNRIRGGAVTIN